MKNEITLDLRMTTRRVGSLFDLMATTFSDDKAVCRAVRAMMTQRQDMEHRPAPGKSLPVAFRFTIEQTVHWFTANVCQLDIDVPNASTPCVSLYLSDLKAVGLTQLVRVKRGYRVSYTVPTVAAVLELPHFAIDRLMLRGLQPAKLKKKLIKRGLDFEQFTLQPETPTPSQQTKKTLASRSSLEPAFATDPGWLSVEVVPRQQMHMINGNIGFTHLRRLEGDAQYIDPFEGQAVANLKKPIVVNADELAELLHWSNLNSRQVNVFRDSLGWVQALASRDYSAFANSHPRVMPLLNELTSSFSIGDQMGVAAEKMVSYLVQQTLGDRLALDEFKRYWAEMSSSFSMINNLQESLNART